MSKKLEAFSRVWEDCSKLDLDYVSKHNLMDDLREIKQALTPPTAEEVCEALENYSGRLTSYKEKHNTFFDDVGYICFSIKKLIYLRRNALPPHLITLVGKFYEGVQHD